MGPPTAAPDSILSVDRLSIRFGGVAALSEVSFEVAPRQTCGLIGPNGAGKTTLFNCISGLYRPQAGEIYVGAAPISRLSPHWRPSLGIGRTFQNLALFPKLTALENVLIGHHIHFRAGFAGCAFGAPGVARDERAARARALDLLALVGLSGRAGEPVGAFPFGHQKRVELARALATEPKLLLLDEPAAGLNPDELDEFGALIRRVRDQFELAIVLVEHHLGLVMALCQKLVALNFGRKIADGTPADVKAHPEVVRAYLGDRP